MENLLLLLSPVLVALAVQLTKKVTSSVKVSTPRRKALLRLLVAILSYGTIVGAAVLNGVEVDPVAVETLVGAVLVFASSQGLYFLGKKK